MVEMGAGKNQGRSSASESTDVAFKESVRALVTNWYAANARPLPWRAPGVSAWGVLVSEVMSQQTPVSRMVEPWRYWMKRWPTPADLARSGTDEVLRAWGRLGYPRRALRLLEAARKLAARGNKVPETEQELLELPGVGRYTAAAILAFAFGRPAWPTVKLGLPLLKQRPSAPEPARGSRRMMSSAQHGRRR